MKSTGTLYVVATPIGNLEDITFRAIRILKEVDYILCEDTRTTKVLLDRYDITTNTMSYNAHATVGRESQIIRMLEEGKNLALVSDAGTPSISDPGVLLISNIYKELGKDSHIVPIPGPSALVTALSACGISSATFTFLGFLPHKKGRNTIFDRIKDSSDAIVFYESTHRIVKTLESLNEKVGDRQVVLARELTKKFEEFLRGTPEELLGHLSSKKESQKGEFVVIVAPR